MVRFKYRNLLVEFLDAGAVAAFPPAQAPPIDLDADDEEAAANGASADNPDPEDELAPLPSLPLVLPLAPGTPLLGEQETGSAVFRAIKGSVMAVFGDEGWARVATSLRVIYASPYTTLTIVRVARPHYRLVWAAITMLTSVGGASVIPRVLAVSGTIKKLQSAAIAHHRRVVAAAVAALLAQGEFVGWGRADGQEKRVRESASGCRASGTTSARPSHGSRTSIPTASHFPPHTSSHNLYA
ncbi:hypothetical protein VHUM_01464 [Vanrija humicola]|uniref:Uncharacterized protein n=1 Tax=Vanrija humicola TaxID=5417 RepID=A0A7D8V1Q1_VANHU|nr:hypothetical protein VHUM_01464 [Vanrija humicola]